MYQDALGNFHPYTRNQAEKIVKGEEFDRIPGAQEGEEWVLQNESGNEYKQTKFLIYVVSMEIEFNEEPVTITFFKDITFGILYEQVMAQGELSHIISNSLDKKIG